MKVGSITASVLSLGAVGNAGAQESGSDGGDGRFREAIATGSAYVSGVLFRVVSPPLEDAPIADPPSVLQNYSVRVIQHFNTNEEEYLFVPEGTAIEEGEQYVFDDRFSSPIEDELAAEDLVRVEYRPLTEEELPLELETEETFEIFDDGGGEAAVRPDNFFPGAPFEIVSGPQGWVPNDIAQSGLFTDYNSVHAEYFGTNRRFLFFPQEGASTEEGNLYVMRNEAEIFDPVGNLVAAEFDPIDEETVTIDDDSLR
ncbi:hypothetical protein NP511_03145 [Natrinema thermotolerans]|uniref:Uncharacterized protein n=1 Tax=Natrinema thermotolerans TaxID=121872 RepID=A0AAF0PCE3_9EURY|nr:hypothetical protein [Natrinema thermotolerans]WMT08637.1 hypothetical protein NP511_03145 [Natrinema thermotolerans]